MANSNIGQLPQQAPIDVVDEDLLVTFDVSASGAARTKHIRVDDAIKAQQRLNGFKSSLLGGAPGSLAIVPYSHPCNNGLFSIAIGDLAGVSSTTGNYWTAIGYGAGSSSTTGSIWLAIGYEAGYSNVSGEVWTAIGYASARSNTSGSFWTAIGYEAGFTNVSSNLWTAVGTRAGYSNSSGTTWTAVGSYAGGSNIVGSNWLGIGYFAGYAASGSNWTALGTLAGLNATGDNFVAIGFASASNACTGNFVSIGYYAGYYETGGDWLAIDSGFYANPLINGNFINRNVGFNSKNFNGGLGVVSFCESTALPTVLPTSGAVFSVSSGIARLGTAASNTVLTDLKGSKSITAPSAVDTITVSGAAVGDVAYLSVARLAAVTASNTVTFDSTGLSGVVNCIVKKFV